MSEPKRPLKVFLCHAHSDATAVRALYSRLTRDGVDAWLDKERLLPGQDWEDEIRKAVRESDVVVVCHSKQFNQRGFRQKEVKIALEEADLLPKGEIFIIPARLEECDVLDDLKRWQWVDLFEKEGYENVVRALRVRANKIGATLQVKRNWLPTITVPRYTRQKPTEIKDKFPDDMHLSSAQFPEGRDKESQPLFESGNSIEKLRSNKFLNVKWSFKSVFMILAIFVVLITSYILLSKLANFSTVPMVVVPSGNFIMGSKADEVLAECQKISTNCQRDQFAIEEPANSVYLNAFYIDRYEVTNSQYAKCVKADVCEPPEKTSSYTHAEYYGNAQYDDYPVIYVNWFQARAYCEWRGARLPSEAEWEKAARYIDGRIYPWGNLFSADLVNFCDKDCPGSASNKKYTDGFVEIAPVGNFEKGQSYYGAYDMVGNVWEWVGSLYQAYPYDSADGREDLSASGLRTIRGGSWWDSAQVVHASFRYGGIPPSTTGYDLGFRCARPVP